MGCHLDIAFKLAIDVISSKLLVGANIYEKYLSYLDCLVSICSAIMDD